MLVQTRFIFACGVFSLVLSATQAWSSQFDDLDKQVHQLISQGDIQAARTAAAKLEAITSDHPDSAQHATGLFALAWADFYLENYKLAVSEFRASLAIREKLPDLPADSVADNLVSLAQAMTAQGGNSEEVIVTYRKAWDREDAGGRYSKPAKFAREKLVPFYLSAGRSDEAVKIQLDALNVLKSAPEDAETANVLEGLAAAYQVADRLEEAKGLHLRALRIQRKVLQSDDPVIAVTLNNLGAIAMNKGRFAEATSYYKECLELRLKAHARGADDIGPKEIGVAYDNIGESEFAGGDAKSAEQDYVKALSLLVGVPGMEDGLVITLDHLARIYKKSRPQISDELLNRAVDMRKAIMSPSHPDVANTYATIARYEAERGDWRAAEKNSRLAAEIFESRAKLNIMPTAGYASNEIKGVADDFALNVVALSHLARSPSTIDSALVQAQWALQSDAEEAFAQVAERFRGQNSALGVSLRRFQDLQAQRAVVENQAVAAVAIGSPDKDELLAKEAALDGDLQKLNLAFATTDVRFTHLFAGAPLNAADIQALLGADEVAVFVFFPPPDTIDPAVFVWLVQNGRPTTWRRLPESVGDLTKSARRIRCSVDPNISQQEDARRACAALGVSVTIDSGKGQPPTFPVKDAYNLYKALLLPFRDQIASKKILFVPSGPLTAVPAGLFLRTLPANGAALASADWLVKTSPIAVLPSLPALGALRSSTSSGPVPTWRNEAHQQRPYLGFGNPLLDGDPDADRVNRKIALDSQSCTAISTDTSAKRLEGRKGTRRRNHQRRPLEALAD